MKAMGKINLFVIKLSGNKQVYFSGSSVEGSVSLELSEPKKTQGISIVFSGKAHVLATVQNTREYYRRAGQRINHSHTQHIFDDVSIQLWGNGKDTQELTSGRYEFPFKFQLASDTILPTSFESDNGYIRYSLLARIHRSWKFDHTTTRAITVNEIVDINTGHLTVPLSISDEKTICCLCCASKPISLSVKTDRGGYCPGESIALIMEVENHSNKRITSVEVCLKQMVVYNARGKRRVRNEVVQRIEA